MACTLTEMYIVVTDMYATDMSGPDTIICYLTTISSLTVHVALYRRVVMIRDEPVVFTSICTIFLKFL